MGKKSKANRKKAPEATLAATAATTPPAAAVAGVATSVATAATAVAKAGWGVEEFPESTFFVKGKSFHKKGNLSKANKLYLQGIENGCVRCMFAYTMKILSDGAAIENVTMVTELINNNMNLHLALPFLLEGAIRGNQDAIKFISFAYAEVQHEKKDSHRFGDIRLATPLILYWQKIGLKNLGREDRPQMKQLNEELKEQHGTQCSVCEKQDSETVTLRKCDGCKFYYYCSKECQQKMWVEGQHAGVCRHLRILQKYHKPFVKKIRTDIVVHRLAPRDIPELQELRERLGLSRPQADYQDLLEAAQASRLESAQLILPRNDGTVQLGSFPRPI